MSPRKFHGLGVHTWPNGGKYVGQYKVSHNSVVDCECEAFCPFLLNNAHPSRFLIPTLPNTTRRDLNGDMASTIGPMVASTKASLQMENVMVKVFN